MAQSGIPYSQSIAMVLVTIILSYFNLVFGELVPKRVALQKAEAFSLFAVKPIAIISRIMAPFIALLSVSTNGVLRLLGLKRRIWKRRFPKKKSAPCFKPAGKAEYLMKLNRI